MLAELQRELIVANTRDGLAAARARGRHGGRRSTLTVDQVRTAQRLYDEGEHTVAQIAAMFGVKRGTLYGHLDHTTVGGRLRAAKTEHRFAPDVAVPHGRGDDPAAALTALTALPRPIRAQIHPADQDLSPQREERGDRRLASVGDAPGRRSARWPAPRAGTSQPAGPRPSTSAKTSPLSGYTRSPGPTRSLSISTARTASLTVTP
ncbi:MAG: helix-turn-helix domain-containing protein [Pseudonocardiaceae bacterium]